MNETLVRLPFGVPLLPVKELRAGNLRCWYERGHLRYICLGSAELLRMIYPAVRDERWGTVMPQIENEIVHVEDDAFFVNYTAVYRQDEIQFKAEISIIGKQNSIAFEFKGEALRSFKKNRIGLCVLHPVDACRGREVLIVHPDDASEISSFPTFVSPHQPFMNVQKMAWTVDAGHRIQLQFEGDVFETEDQRNWTDNSYKTYSTPLEKPFPQRIEKGSSVVQRVVVNIINQETGQHRINRTSPQTGIGWRNIPLLGDSFESDWERSANGVRDLLKDLPFDHYSLTLDLASPDWKTALSKAAADTPVQTPLALTVCFSASFEQECEVLLPALAEIALKIGSVLPLLHQQPVTPSVLLKFVYPKIKTISPHIRVGYGTDQFFAELNRNRPLDSTYDFLAFGLHPQVHASDTRTIIENLQSLEQVMHSITQFAQKPIFVLPISFAAPTGKIDERLHTGFGATWFLLCLKNLARASQLTFSRIGLAAGIEGEPSPLLDVLQRLNRFKPISISCDGVQDNISFKNAAGEILTFIVSPEFKQATAYPLENS